MRVFDVVRVKELWIIATRKEIKVLDLISSSISESEAFERMHRLRKAHPEETYHVIPWNDVDDKARLAHYRPGDDKEA